MDAVPLAVNALLAGVYGSVSERNDEEAMLCVVCVVNTGFCRQGKVRVGDVEGTKAACFHRGTYIIVCIC